MHPQQIGRFMWSNGLHAPALLISAHPPDGGQAAFGFSLTAGTLLDFGLPLAC
jgi:hypothetical protein